jgi:hypothetical protein
MMATSLTDPSLFRLPRRQNRAAERSIHPRSKFIPPFSVSSFQHFTLCSPIIPIHGEQLLKFRFLQVFLKKTDL